MSELRRVLESTVRVLRKEGVGTFVEKALRYSQRAAQARVDAIKSGASLADVLIVHSNASEATAQSDRLTKVISEELRLAGWAVTEREQGDLHGHEARYAALIIFIGAPCYRTSVALRAAADTYARPVVVAAFSEADVNSVLKNSQDSARVKTPAAFLLSSPSETQGKTEQLCTTQGIACFRLPKATTEQELTIEGGKNGSSPLARLLAAGPRSDCFDENSTTVHCAALSHFLYTQLNRSIAIVLPSTNVSGGVNVVMEHARFLQQAGHDVTILTTADEPSREITFRGERLSIVATRTLPSFRAFDVMVATFFTTVPFVLAYGRARHKAYLVQGYETDFMEHGHPWRLEAESSYSPLLPLSKITVSKWCKSWLKSRYHAEAALIPNSIDREHFSPTERDFSGKVRVLIEGDPSTEIKNIDEAFRIANLLDREHFEVWFLSSSAKPKDWYRCERVFQRVPYEEVPSIYQQCHILLKTSLLESFSFPPLEMMSTGGFVVAIQNNGNAEYLKHGENALLFASGEIDLALEHCQGIANDPKLRERLRRGGESTAEERSHKNKLSLIESAYFVNTSRPKLHRSSI